MSSLTAIAQSKHLVDLRRSTAWPAYTAFVWALAYAAYRAYYALGGTFGMFGTPVSMHQWRVVNGAGAAVILLGALLPIAIIPLWRRERTRRILLAFCWVVAVGCVMHAMIDDVQRLLSLAGLLHLDLPFWTTTNSREADLQDLLFNEPWFLVEGLLWGALGWFELRSVRARTLWLATGLVAVAIMTTIGMLSAFGVIGTFIVG